MNQINLGFTSAMNRNSYFDTKSYSSHGYNNCKTWGRSGYRRSQERDQQARRRSSDRRKESEVKGDGKRDNGKHPMKRERNPANEKNHSSSSGLKKDDGSIRKKKVILAVKIKQIQQDLATIRSCNKILQQFKPLSVLQACTLIT